MRAITTYWSQYGRIKGFEGLSSRAHVIFRLPFFFKWFSLNFFQYIFLLLGRFSLLHKTESNTNIFNGLSDMTILKVKGKELFLHW